VKNAPHLTAGHAPEVARQIECSHAGMAYFASTGPLGATCKECAFYGYHRKYRDKFGDTTRAKFRHNACRRFFELTNKHGPDVPENAEACRYFECRKST
jgi:hypothetical protein